jgi:adenylate cyclase
MVNFSALSSEVDTNRLGELVEIFESRCGDVVASQEGRMIKTLGDSVLFVHDDPQRALDIAAGLIDVIGEDSRLPDVHIGLATGPVVTRLGDVFGPPVNLAARLTALARRNRVIADQATVDGLAPLSYEARRLTARPLRGFGLVEPVAVRRVRQRSQVRERRTKVPGM